MERYIIQCTEEQTEKALKLGAPIMVADTLGDLVLANYFTNEDNHVATIIPTAEQMIGWLEESLIGELRLEQDIYEKWGYIIYDNYSEEIDMIDYKYPSRKEATLEAIDAALDYLLKAKEE